MRHTPALHLIGRPVVVAPGHLGRAEDEAEYEAEEYRQEDTEHQTLQADKLQISIGYDRSEGQGHHRALRSRFQHGQRCSGINNVVNKVIILP